MGANFFVKPQTKNSRQLRGESYCAAGNKNKTRVICQVFSIIVYICYICPLQFFKSVSLLGSSFEKQKCEVLE